MLKNKKIQLILSSTSIKCLGIRLIKAVEYIYTESHEHYWAESEVLSKRTSHVFHDCKNSLLGLVSHAQMGFVCGLGEGVSSLLLVFLTNSSVACFLLYSILF